MTTIAENLKIIMDSTADIKQAIIEKGGDVGNLTTYADAIRGIQTGSSSFWTGHVDVEGLKAIGWDDDDIAYFQEHGVNWKAEDDEYYKVSDDNKALYGVLTVDNIQEYKDRIVWLPKMDFSRVTSFESKFRDCVFMKGLPKLDVKNATQVKFIFYGCHSLTCIHLVNTHNCINFSSSFRMCYSLMYINPIDTSARTQGIDFAFHQNYSLKEGISLYLGNQGDIRGIYNYCSSMERCEDIDAEGRDIGSIFAYCYALKEVKIKNLAHNLPISQSTAFSKPSLLYVIENEAATSSIIITLHAAAYARLANDPDIVAALSNHPNVSLASA